MKNYLFFIVISFLLITESCCELQTSDSPGDPIVTIKAKLIGDLPAHVDPDKLRAAVLWIPDDDAWATLNTQELMVLFRCDERRKRDESWLMSCVTIQKKYKDFLVESISHAQRLVDAPLLPDGSLPKLPWYIAAASVQKYADVDSTLSFPSTISLDLHTIPSIQFPDGDTRAVSSSGIIVVYQDDGNNTLDIVSMDETRNSPDRIVAVSAFPGVQTDDSDILYTGLLYSTREVKPSYWPYYYSLKWIDECPDELDEGFSILTLRAAEDGCHTCEITPVKEVIVPLYYLESDQEVPLCESPYFETVYPIHEPPKNSRLKCISKDKLRFEISPETYCAQTFDFDLRSLNDPMYTEDNGEYAYDMTDTPPSFWSCDGKDIADNVETLPGGRISASNDFTCTITEDQTLNCFGNLPNLGDETDSPESGVDAEPICSSVLNIRSVPCEEIGCVPEYVEDLNMVQVSVGETQVCILDDDGGVVCWNPRSGERLKNNLPQSGVVEISAKTTNPCVRYEDGSIQCIGSCTSTVEYPEIDINCPWYLQTKTYQGEFSYLAANDTGNQPLCAIKAEDDTLDYFGDKYDAVALPPGKYVQITPYRKGYCALTTTGFVVCFANWNTERYTAPLDRFKYIDGGKYFACGIKLDDELKCWGVIPGPYLNPPKGKFVDVAVGDDHACAIDKDGNTVCFGYDLDINSPDN